jgi:hypothetical protein
MPSPNNAIDKRDFDANRPLLQDIDAEPDTGDRRHDVAPARLRAGSRSSGDDGIGMRSDDGLLSDVVDEIVERDRRMMHVEVVRVGSFAWGVVTWYGILSLLLFLISCIVLSARR